MRLNRLVHGSSRPEVAQSFLYRLCLWVTLLASATSFFFLYLQFFNWNPDPRITLPGMVYGTAHRPFVYRVLAPALIRLLAAITPLSLRFLAAAIMYLSLVGFVFAFRYLLSALWRPSLFTDLLSIGAILALTPFILSAGRHLYDFSTLGLFTLGFALMARARWTGYLLIFLLACLNKETALLLGLVFALHFYRKITAVAYRNLLLLQAALYAATRLTLAWVFRNNPGELVEYHLPQQFEAVAAHPGLTAAWLCLGVWVAGLVLYRWKDKPVFLRNALLAALPPLAVLFLFFGAPFEFRVFYEVYPVIFLLAAHTVGLLLGLKLDAP